MVDLRKAAATQDPKSVGEALHAVLSVINYVARKAGLAQDRGYVDLAGPAQLMVDRVRRTVRAANG